MKRTILISLFLLLFTSTATATMVTGEVTRVKDGDTVVLSVGENIFLTCRMRGIDAPELQQPFGKAASEKLKTLIGNSTVTIELTGRKTFGREVCIIWKDHEDINLTMVREGYAWVIQRFIRDSQIRAQYMKAKNNARSAGLGLWSQENPESPRQFRN